MYPIKTVAGTVLANHFRFAIVAARFNEFVVEALVRGAIDTLTRHGAKPEQIELIRVPGAFELPLASRAAAQSKRFHAVIALGAVIKGQTAHFDYVCGECASGLSRVATDTGIPVSFGVLTTETIEQAIERSGAKAGNKGGDAALVALEMANLMKELGA